jgi:hypothetical protein
VSLKGAYSLLNLLNDLEAEGISVDPVPDTAVLKVQYEDYEPMFIEPRYDADSNLYLWAVTE